MTTNQKVDKVTTVIDLDSIDSIENVDFSNISETVVEEITQTPSQDDGGILVSEKEASSFGFEIPTIEDDEDLTNNEGKTNVQQNTKKQKNQNDTAEEILVVDEGSEQEENQSSETSSDQTQKGKTSRSQSRIRELAAKAKEEAQKRQLTEEANKALIKRLEELEKERLEREAKVAESESNQYEQLVSRAKGELQRAYQEGDSDAIVEAQQKLNDAQFRYNLANVRKTNALKEKEIDNETLQKRVRDGLTKHIPENIQQNQEDNSLDYDDLDESTQKAMAWAERNRPVLGKQEVINTSTYLFGVLEKEGFKPDSDEIYEELERRLSLVHPELERWFSYNKPQQTKTNQMTKQVSGADKAPTAAPSSQTASSTKDINSPNKRPPVYVKGGKVYLNPTPEDKAMMARLGFNTPQQQKDYLLERMKTEENLKKGIRSSSIF